MIACAFCRWFIQFLIGPPPVVREQLAVLAAVEDFRTQRADDFAQALEKNGSMSARLAEAQFDLHAWQDYAHELERLCMKHGLPIPPGPQE